MAFEFFGNNLKEIQTEYKRQHTKIQNSYIKRIESLQANGKVKLAQKYVNELNRKLDELDASYKEKIEFITQKAADHGQVKKVVGGESFQSSSVALQESSQDITPPPLPNLKPDLKIVNNANDKFNVHTCQYKEEVSQFNDLLNDNVFMRGVANLLETQPEYNNKKELLKTSFQLNENLTPELFQIINECKERLNLTVEVEIYAYQDSRFNAYISPGATPEDPITIVISSGLIENFDYKEIQFVLGHELGHYVFNHLALPAMLILNQGHDFTSPLHAMKLYAWLRNSELSADRVGLICCQDLNAVIKAFFKLSSGITSGVNLKVKDYIAQYKDLESELSNSEINPQDYYTTHPCGALRVRAIELFSKTNMYHKLIDSNEAKYSFEKVENEISRFMNLMEPNYLNDESDKGLILQKLLLFAGYYIANSDGHVDPSEVEALKNLVSPKVFDQHYPKLRRLREFRDIEDQLIELGKEADIHFTGADRYNLVRDLAVIVYADGVIDEREMNALYFICRGLGVDPNFAYNMINQMQVV